ncbi:MAG: 2-oxo acid dehydrogenase subunit E2, partial [Planctomycetota bacterium]|nr:2-oxo acid dehydrogenase subunit E2 [Planctomycetota bacterium]
NESLMMNITMGPSELRPIVQNERVVIRPVAPLFVRADHRTVDAYRIAQFTETLRSYISNPDQMDVQTGTRQATSNTKQNRSEAKPPPDARAAGTKSNTHHTTSSPA